MAGRAGSAGDILNAVVIGGGKLVTHGPAPHSRRQPSVVGRLSGVAATWKDDGVRNTSLSRGWRGWTACEPGAACLAREVAASSLLIIGGNGQCRQGPRHPSADTWQPRFQAGPILSRGALFARVVGGTLGPDTGCGVGPMPAAGQRSPGKCSACLQASCPHTRHRSGKWEPEDKGKTRWRARLPSTGRLGWVKPKYKSQNQRSAWNVWVCNRSRITSSPQKLRAGIEPCLPVSPSPSDGVGQWGLRGILGWACL